MQRERCCDLCENANMSVWNPSSYSFLSSHKTLYPASRQVFSLFISPSLILWIALITEKSLFTWLSVQMPKDTTSTATRLIIMWRISAFCCCNTLYLSSCLPANIMNTAPLLGGNTIVIVFNSCYKFYPEFIYALNVYRFFYYSIVLHTTKGMPCRRAFYFPYYIQK